MKKIRCILIDDEPPAIALLQKYAGMIETLEVLGTANSAVKAFDLLKEIEVDLIFLDIRMPVLNGLDFLKTLKNPPAVIITTAYREYALDGYDLDIVDYLLKPIAFDRFLKGVNRFIEKNTFQPAQTKSNETEKNNFLYFNVNKTHHKIYFDDITYLESLKDYVRIHTKKDKLVVKGNLGSILKQLPSAQFLRIHRSYAIPIDDIQSFNQSELHVHDIKLPIGVSYRKEVIEILKK